MGDGEPRFLGFTPDGRARYEADYELEPSPLAGGADPDEDYQVDQSADDGYETNLGTTNIALAYVYVLAHATAPYWGAVRFRTGTFPALWSNIIAATLSVNLYSITYDSANFDIYAEDAASPAVFEAGTGNYNISLRTRTSDDTKVPWVADDIAAGGTGWFDAPSVIGPIQEVVDAYAPTAIVLILKPRTDATKAFRFYSWDQTGNVSGAKLHLEWLEPVTHSAAASLAGSGAVSASAGKMTWVGKAELSSAGAFTVYGFDIEQIDAGTDDAEEIESSGAMDLVANPYVLSSYDIAWRRWGGLRFDNGPFPLQGSRILTAYFEINVVGNDGDANFDIYAQASADPATFTASPGNITGRARTDVSVSWVADGLGTGWKASPSIVSVVQELVDNYGPTAIVLVL
jgi:hypothetical protein